MKTNRFAAASSVAAAILIGALAAFAQQTTPATPATQSNQNNQTDQNNQNAGTTNNQTGTVRSNAAQSGTKRNDQSIGKLDDKTPQGTARVSKLIGANLQNANGDSVGEIKDLVIDHTGKIRYAAVTYGGFLGVGSKMYAVPFEAFKVRQNPSDPNDADDYVLTLNVTKQQLDGAQGFDSDRWPNFADTKFTQDLDRRYNVTRTPAQTGTGTTR